MATTRKPTLLNASRSSKSALARMIENDRIRKAAEERNERRFGIKPASRPL